MTYTLDGVPLIDASGRFWLDNTTGVRILPARRNAALTLPGRDGVVADLNPTFEPGGVSLSVVVTGATYSLFNANLEFLYGLLGQRGRLLPLMHVLPVGGNRYIDIQVVSASEPETLGPRTARIKVLATAPDPFWRDSGILDSTLPLTATATTGILTGHAGATGTIDDALIRVQGGLSAATLTDPVTGDFIKVTAALTATEYIIIDTVNWTAKKVTTDTWTGGTDVSASVDSSRGYGPMLMLNPDFSTGAGRVRLTVSCTNPVTAPAVIVRAKRSFL
jgi:hypothetical protein